MNFTFDLQRFSFEIRTSSSSIVLESGSSGSISITTSGAIGIVTLSVSHSWCTVSGNTVTITVPVLAKPGTRYITISAIDRYYPAIILSGNDIKRYDYHIINGGGDIISYNRKIVDLKTDVASDTITVKVIDPSLPLPKPI